MTLISDEYRQLNAQLHEDRDDYGARGHKFLPYVEYAINVVGADSVLDYGCGKNTLIKAMKEAGVPLDLRGYDPAREEFNVEPMPADVVVCNDVLEHIEPEHLEAVLDHLQALARKAVVLTVSTRPAVKTLADGRNAHLIVENARWWYPKLRSRFGKLMHFNARSSDFAAIFVKEQNHA